MVKRATKIMMSLLAALAIAVAGTATTVNIAAAQAPAAPWAQAEDEKGVLIVAVQRNGPAAKAGIRRGDIILAVNDIAVNDAQALRDALAKLKPGDEARIRVARGDSELTFKVTLGEADGRAILGVTPFQATLSQPEVTPAPPAQAPKQLPFDPEQWRKRLEEQLRRFSTQVRVTEVITGSPAAKAGLQRDDIILAVNDTRLDAQNLLPDVIAQFKPGDVVTLTIRRKDTEQKLKVTLGENPDKKGVAFLGIRYVPVFGPLGQLPRNIPVPPFVPPGTDAPAPESWAAVTINDVAANSPAEKAGLKPGDTILAANDKPITSPQQLVELVRNSKPGDRVTLSVQRQGEDKPREITVTLGRHPDKAGAAYMGVSLGQFIRFERILPGSEGSGGPGLEILPGFRLPFEFNFDDFPFPLPPPEPEIVGRDA